MPTIFELSPLLALGQTMQGVNVSGTGQALVLSAAVAGFVTALLKPSLFPKLPRQVRILVPVTIGAIVAVAYAIWAGIPWPDAIIVALTGGPVASGVREGVTHARKEGPKIVGLLLIGTMSIMTQGCASFPEVKPYTYDDHSRSGEQLCSDIAKAAGEQANGYFYGGWAASILGGGTLATLAAMPDRNLKIGDVDGEAVRAGFAFLAGGVVAAGVYMVLHAAGLDELAADTKAAMVFGDGETMGLNRDQVAWSMCLDSWSAYDDAGSKRRVDQIAPVE
jgi:hypothetical protein